jgi:hypothetical protein
LAQVIEPIFELSYWFDLENIEDNNNIIILQLKGSYEPTNVEMLLNEIGFKKYYEKHELTDCTQAIFFFTSFLFGIVQGQIQDFF